MAGGLLAGVAGLAPAAPSLPSAQVAWVPAATDADVDRAFAKARAENKPVLLYWGASWCPPCNQLKATFFNRQDFAAQARHLVAVHVDGDRPGAQKLGTRFKVRGYPTVILMSPQGAEITRLPGEADAPQIMLALQAGLSGGRPVLAVLADARAGKALSADEWRVLAFHSWETDESQRLPAPQRAAALADLAARAPAGDGETSTRLWLKAAAAAAKGDGQGVKPDAALRARVQRVLSDPAMARAQMDVLLYGATGIIELLSAPGSAAAAAGAGSASAGASPGGTTGAQVLAAAFDAALTRLQGDATLSRGDRVSAAGARVDIARLDVPDNERHPRLPPALLRDLRELAARMDREITDAYERQAVIPALAHALGEAGLWGDADALLQTNLARSPSAYYLMSQLGSQARKQGRPDEALRWYARSFDSSVGPATRLQWGAGYLAALVDLSPTDAKRIEATSAKLFAEAATDAGAFHERSGRSLQRVSTKLLEWNAGGQQEAALRRLRVQLQGICAKVEAADGQRAACEKLLRPAPKAAS